MKALVGYGMLAGMGAWKLAAKRPALSALIVGVLAVGVCGTTAVFALANALFLTPLPFAEPSRLVDLNESAPKWGVPFVSIAYPDFHAWRAENASFEAMAAYRDDSMNLALEGRARRLNVAKITHGLGEVLKIAPLLGRHFTPEDDTPGAPKVVQLVESTWRAQYGADPLIVGKTMRLDEELYEIVGVLPDHARFIEDADAWTPLAADVLEGPDWWYLRGIGRLRPGVSVETARADLLRIHRSLIPQRDVNAITIPIVRPLLEREVGHLESATMFFLAAVGLVLLMACVNVGGLMLVHARAREREIGVRVALGASTQHIVRQLLAETAVLAVAGGAIGALAGRHVLRVFTAEIPQELPHWIRVDLDGRVVAFTLVVVSMTALVSGLAPALRAARTDVLSALRPSGAPGRIRLSGRRGAYALVALEIAAAVVLLVAAGLLVTSSRVASHVDPGFRPEGVLAFRATLPKATYPSPENRYPFWEELIERLLAIPGVERAGVVNTAPLGKHEGAFFEVEGGGRDPERESPVVLARLASPGYFDAIGAELLRGRWPEPADAMRDVALVNQSFITTFWPDADPNDLDAILGRRIRPSAFDDSPWLDVIGVVRDVKHYGLDQEVLPGMYYPYGRRVGLTMTTVVRVMGTPEAIVPQVRASLAELDPGIPIYAVTTMEGRIADALWRRRASALFASVFAMFALVLAAAGIYGVVSVSARERRQEIGIRLALGAHVRRVLLTVLSPGMRFVALGVIVGFVIAMSLRPWLNAYLFGVAGDVAVHWIVAAGVSATALVAQWVPARRATRMEIADVLKAD